ncbi:MAG: hypothetical protein C0506_08680 [Anaerolinea sp.]|nr:hypothetical protein [Anaerolinea sp.]
MHNMPGPPATGREAVLKTIESFLKGWQRTEWEIVNLAASATRAPSTRLPLSKVTTPAAGC